MRMMHIIIFGAVFLLSGCGTQTQVEQPLERTKSTTSDTDDSAIGRARIHTELAVNYLEIGNLAIALEDLAERRHLGVAARGCVRVLGEGLHLRATHLLDPFVDHRLALREQRPRHGRKAPGEVSFRDRWGQPL